MVGDTGWGSFGAPDLTSEDNFCHTLAMTKNLQDFLSDYDPEGSRTVATIEVPNHDDVESPFIVLKYGDKTVIVNPMGLGDHLCVDVHSFVDGEDATAGVFGMSNGKRWTLPETTGTTSHGWSSARLVALLVGEQKIVEVD